MRGSWARRRHLWCRLTPQIREDQPHLLDWEVAPQQDQSCLTLSPPLWGNLLLQYDNVIDVLMKLIKARLKPLTSLQPLYNPYPPHFFNVLMSLSTSAASPGLLAFPLNSSNIFKSLTLCASCAASLTIPHFIHISTLSSLVVP